MKKTVLLTCLALFLFFTGSAFADVGYTFSLAGPSPYMGYNYGGIGHGGAYVQGINADKSYIGSNNTGSTLLDAFNHNNEFANQTIDSATLHIKNLTNYYYSGDDCNDFYLQLLDNGGTNTTGTTSFYRATSSDHGNTNYFQDELHGVGTELTDFNVGNNETIADATYTFQAASTQLAALNTYITNNGFFGLGFDPDCHYTYDGIKLDITVTPPATTVPEPATMVLFGMGLVGFAAVARKKLPKKGGERKEEAFQSDTCRRSIYFT